MRFDTKLAVVLDESLETWQAPVATDDLDLAGLALHADRRVVDKVLDRLRPHP